jgi:hypothetical protein
MKVVSQVVNYIKTYDDIVKPSHTRLNFQSDKLQKSLIGGLLSIFVTLFVLEIAIEKGIKMVSLNGPSISSQFKGIRDMSQKATAS